MASNVGVATINFGAMGANEASVAVIGQADIKTTSKTSAWISCNGASADHTANDHKYASILASFVCGNVIEGVGFTIYGISEHKLTGSFLLEWVWSD